MTESEMYATIEQSYLNLEAYFQTHNLTPVNIFQYGFSYEKPENMVVNIEFQTNDEKERALSIHNVEDECYKELRLAGFPKGREDGVSIGFASKETIGESSYDAYLYYK